jgi:predicted DCC family thiol-disulfide oxidoreductase YuxK
MVKDVPEANDKMVIVYDGLCPFCTSYVRLMSLRRSVGAVELVDARSAHPEVQRLVNLGYDLNEGMAAIYGGKIYFGSDATVVISAMTQARGPFGRLLAIMLSNPARARFLYPFLKAGRRLALIILRRPAL